MRITVLGAGALGRAYGVRLAAAGYEVAFVVRPQRVAETSPFSIEQVNGPKRRDVIERPRRVAEIPLDTQAVLVTVRFDQLAHAQPGAAAASSASAQPVVELLRCGPAVPVVVLTPSMPPEHAALAEALGRPHIAAMPSISGYIDERDVVRYWLPGFVSTLIDAADALSPEHRAAVEALARNLTSADVPARIERDVGAQNAATTTAFFPLIAAIDAGGGVEGLLANKAVLQAALDAAKECDALAHRLGRVAPWANLLTRFVGPFTLKPGVALARRLFPEAVRFVDHHFGPKLHEQHLAMGATILAMGRERGVELPSLERLMGLLEGRPDPR